MPLQGTEEKVSAQLKYGNPRESSEVEGQNSKPCSLVLPFIKFDQMPA
jgi:hypothetical protein